MPNSQDGIDEEWAQGISWTALHRLEDTLTVEDKRWMAAHERIPEPGGHHGFGLDCSVVQGCLVSKALGNECVFSIKQNSTTPLQGFSSQGLNAAELQITVTDSGLEEEKCGVIPAEDVVVRTFWADEPYKSEQPDHGGLFSNHVEICPLTISVSGLAGEQAAGNGIYNVFARIGNMPVYRCSQRRRQWLYWKSFNAQKSANDATPSGAWFIGNHLQMKTELGLGEHRPAGLSQRSSNETPKYEPVFQELGDNTWCLEQPVPAVKTYHRSGGGHLPATYTLDMCAHRVFHDVECGKYFMYGGIEQEGKPDMFAVCGCAYAGETCYARGQTGRTSAGLSTKVYRFSTDPCSCVAKSCSTGSYNAHLNNPGGRWCFTAGNCGNQNRVSKSHCPGHHWAADTDGAKTSVCPSNDTDWYFYFKVIPHVVVTARQSALHSCGKALRFAGIYDRSATCMGSTMFIFSKNDPSNRPVYVNSEHKALEYNAAFGFWMASGGVAFSEPYEEALCPRDVSKWYVWKQDSGSLMASGFELECPSWNLSTFVWHRNMSDYEYDRDVYLEKSVLKSLPNPYKICPERGHTSCFSLRTAAWSGTICSIVISLAALSILCCVVQRFSQKHLQSDHEDVPSPEDTSAEEEDSSLSDCSSPISTSSSLDAEAAASPSRMFSVRSTKSTTKWLVDSRSKIKAWNLRAGVILALANIAGTMTFAWLFAPGPALNHSCLKQRGLHVKHLQHRILPPEIGGSVWASCRCVLIDYMLFWLLILFCLAAGFAGPFMLLRSGASSSHVLLAVGYTVLNVFAALISGVLPNHVHVTGEDTGCHYGILNGGDVVPILGLPGDELLRLLWVGRVLLYTVCVHVLQCLIQDRLAHVENEWYQCIGSRCLKMYLRLQSVIIVLLAIYWVQVVGRQEELGSSKIVDVSLHLPVIFMLVGGLAALVPQFIVAASLWRVRRAASRMLESHQQDDESRSQMRRSGSIIGAAQRTANLQLLGASMTVITSVTCMWFNLNSMRNQSQTITVSQIGEVSPYAVAIKIAAMFDAVISAATAVVLSGGHRVTRNATQSEMVHWPSLSRKHRKYTRLQSNTDPGWDAKVTDLASRGLTLEAILGFYKQLGNRLMPNYRAETHRTSDVVRQAIIPASAQARSALSCVLMDGEPCYPMVMVTHTWSNRFRDLIAAVAADALGDQSFAVVARLLQDDVEALEEALTKADCLQHTYWICAFSVNQHSAICGENPHRERDPVTGIVHPICTCACPKFFHGSQCEINKFDDMMELLLDRDRSFRQAVAVDSEFSLFDRAWCIAELAQANRMGMTQQLLLPSGNCLQGHQDHLRRLRVQDMQATRAEDVQFILSKINDVDDFNRNLQTLIFDQNSGLLTVWKEMDSLQQMAQAGRILRWAATGSDKIWRALQDV